MRKGLLTYFGYTVGDRYPFKIFTINKSSPAYARYSVGDLNALDALAYAAGKRLYLRLR